MNPFDPKSYPGVVAGNAATTPQAGPRVTLIPGEPARSHTLDEYVNQVEIAPGVIEETVHAVRQHFAAEPERVQIDMSKADAQLLQGLLANIGLDYSSPGSAMRALLSALATCGLPPRDPCHVVIDGRQVHIREAFLGLK